MKNTKRLMAFLMALVLGFSLTGCFNKEDKEEPVDKNGDVTLNDDLDEEKESVELTWYLIGGPQPDLPMVTDEINKYTKEKIGATLKTVQLDWSDYEQKMPVIINSGDKVDICFTASWQQGAPYATMVNRGAFMPLDDLLQEYGQGILDILNPMLLDGARIGGKIYGVPTNKEAGQQMHFVYNKTYIDKYDIPYEEIKTLEDLEPYLQLIKEKEPDVLPLREGNGLPYIDFDDFFEGFGVKLYDDTEKIYYKYELPEYIEGARKMREYFLKGYVHPDAATMTSYQEYDTTGKWFVMTQGYVPFAESIWESWFDGYEVVSAPVHDAFVNTGSCQGSLNAIPVTSEYPEKAMEFLNLLNTDPYVRNTINFGIEDVHYKKLSNDVIEFIDGHDDYKVPQFTLGNWFVLYRFQNEPENKWDVFQQWNESCYPSPALGFIPDESNMTAEKSALANIKQEFDRAVRTGSVDVDEVLPLWLDKIKEAGGEKVRTEIQQQYDEWRATK